jgi:hypothetical protein
MDPDAKQRIDDLERRVETLEERLSALQPDSGGNSADTPFDEYDRHVLNRIEETGQEPNPRRIRTLYNEAGIIDGEKIKTRHKRLKRLGAIEDALSA